MVEYTAAKVKKLRELTGAGILDSKNALVSAGGDIDKAIELLRIKGVKDIVKRSARFTTEGLIAYSRNALIELNSETDFVAKNKEFQILANKIVEAVSANKTSNLDTIKAISLDGNTIDKLINNLSIKIGEKISLKRAAYLDGNIEVYMHKRSVNLPPSVGVLVQYINYSPDKSIGRNAAHLIAMQIASLKAKYLKRSDIPANIIESETHIAKEFAKKEGKSKQVTSSIIAGHLTNYYKNLVLEDQPLVSDSKKTVNSLLKETNIVVSNFVRFEVGLI